MKIGVFIPEFPGQTHSFFWREIEALRKTAGVSSRIISTRPPPEPVHHDWVRNVQADYLFPLPLGAWPASLAGLIGGLPALLRDAPSRALLRRPKSWALALFAIRLGQICKAEGIDHLHVHSCANAALVAALCHQMTGLPYSVVLHGPLKDYGPDQDYKWRGAKFGFVITEVLRASLAETLPDVIQKTQIVPMGVDTDTFAPPKTARIRAEGAPFRWFCCARLNPVKGFETLLTAMAELKAHHPDMPCELRVAGNDELGGQGYRKTLEAKIQQLGLEGQVTLLGAITQDQVLQELHGSDGFVLASHHEPLGVAYMEAMACGLPTIGTDAGGVTELIASGEDGLLVAPKDAAALGQAMAQVMADAPLRESLAQAGRAKIVTQFGARRSVDALLEQLA